VKQGSLSTNAFFKIIHYLCIIYIVYYIQDVHIEDFPQLVYIYIIITDV